METKRYYATLEEILALEGRGINIVYDAFGELANGANQGVFITDRNILDDGRGPYIVTEVIPDQPRTSE